MKNIAIFSSNYKVSSNIDGIGLRLWEIAQVLSKYYKIKMITKSISDFSHPNIEFFLFKNEGWKEIVRESDIIFCTDMPDTKVLLYAYEMQKPIITENAVPLEHLDYNDIKNNKEADKLYKEVMAAYQLQLLLSSHFIARSTIERATLLASLGTIGRINYQNYTDQKLSKLISHIPIGFNSHSEKHAANSAEFKHNFDFLWNGGVWDSYDTAIIPKALDRLRNESISTKVGFMYEPPENQYINEVFTLRKTIKEFNLGDNIEFLKPTTHYKRDPIVKGTKALICIGRDSIENYTCHRLRLRDVFLYQKPIITDSFGATGSIVKELGIGLTVKSEEELSIAMKELIQNKKLYNQLVRNIQQVRNEYLMDNTIEPLIRTIESNEFPVFVNTIDQQVQLFLEEHFYLVKDQNFQL
jgi:glycosyltransferase involved in cell wall biosynthesis